MVFTRDKINKNGKGISFNTYKSMMRNIFFGYDSICTSFWAKCHPFCSKIYLKSRFKGEINVIQIFTFGQDGIINKIWIDSKMGQNKLARLNENHYSVPPRRNARQNNRKKNSTASFAFNLFSLSQPPQEKKIVLGFNWNQTIIKVSAFDCTRD